MFAGFINQRQLLFYSFKISFNYTFIFLISAHGENVFCDEITPISVKAKKDIIIDTDQIPRLDLTAQELSIIPPTLDDGTIVTTGNSTVGNIYKIKNTNFGGYILSIYKQIIFTTAYQ